MSKRSLNAKPLRGNLITGVGDFSSISADNLKIPTDVVQSLIAGTQLDNVKITNSEIINSIIGANGGNEAYFTKLTTTSDVTFFNIDKTNYVAWDSINSILNIDADMSIQGCVTIGNLHICQNTISAINNNGNIYLRPKNLGTLYLDGPIYNNVSSYGNFYTNLEDGNISLNASDSISFYSKKSFVDMRTFSDQTFTLTNGDFTINTETGISSKNINTIFQSNGNVIVTCNVLTELRVGNVVTLSNTNSNPNMDGNFIVQNIISGNSFQISTSNTIVTISTIGSMIKTISDNNINLNASRYVTIPTNIPIILGSTSGNLNSISGNTSGINIETKGDIIIKNPDTNSTSSNYIIQLPQYSKLQLGTSGNNNLNFDGNSMNINSNNININTNDININGINGYLNLNRVLIKHQNPLIGNFDTNNNDITDRGVQFRYSDTIGNMKIGWFGYKQQTQQFTFLTNAINTNETITGDNGKFNIGEISVTNITFNSNGSLNMACGNILNVKLLTGCSGILNINASSNVNISASNRISLISGGDVYIPNNIPLTFGSNSILENTNSDLLLRGVKNIRLTTQLNGSIMISNGNKLTFDGTSVGSQYVVSDSLGNLLIASNKNITLNMNSGNIILPSNNSITNFTQSSIQFGNVGSETISGGTNGINIITKSTFGTVNILANSNINILNSTGNVVLNSLVGDINLYATNGNIRVLPLSRLVFNTNGTTNSIRTNTAGNMSFNGPGNTNSGNTIEFKNALNLNLSITSSGSINIPSDVFMRLGNSYIISDSNNNLNTSSGNLSVNVVNNLNLNSNDTNLKSNNITISSANLSTINTNINITSQNTSITGSIMNVNTQNVKLLDPILTIGNYTSNINDVTDRGIEFPYFTSGSMKLGWFGRKSNSGRFIYYSDSINTNEVITGTIGQFELGSAFITDSLTFLNSGNINMNCGTISNLNTILGCSGIVNIIGSNNINVSSNNIFLSATSKILIPYNTPLSFGHTANNMSSDTNGNLIITALNGAGNIILNSNVQINGTTQNVYSTITNIQDPIFSIGGVVGPTLNDMKDRGIEFKWFTGSTKTGFFGFQNNTQRFVFIPDGINNNEIYSGTFGNVQFGNGFFNNLDTNCGTISNLNTIIGCNGYLNVKSSNINLETTNLLLPFNSNIIFGNTQNAISVSTTGTLNISVNNGINLLTNTTGSGFVNIPSNTSLNIGISKIIQDTTGSLNIINTFGNINLTPVSNGSLVLPTNNSIIFSGINNNNRIVSDGTQLQLYGYSNIGLNSSSVTISGNVNVIGNINANEVTSDVGKYILPLGTSQILAISSITNSSTNGILVITTNLPNYLSSGDSVVIKNTNSNPVIDNTYIVTSTVNNTSFNISHTNLLLSGSIGKLISVLTTYQGKDVGIRVDYWSTVGNTTVTSGSLNYKSGFFGWKNNTERWSFYNNATISNNIVTGNNFGDVQINQLYTNKISGFLLDGSLIGSNFLIEGSNFKINGGYIDNTIIGQTIAQTARFTNLSSTISSNLSNLTLQNTLNYSVERYTLSSLVPTRNPNNSIVTTFFSISGVSFTNASGTLGNVGITDGQIKKIICSSMGMNSNYTLHFGLGKLITPNPLGINPSKIVFKRQGQSCSVIFDAILGAWILESGNAYCI